MVVDREMEQRVLAVEVLLLALAPWIDDVVVEDAAATLRVDLLDAEGEERAVVVQALQLLTDGRMRFKGPELGRWIRAGD